MALSDRDSAVTHGGSISNGDEPGAGSESAPGRWTRLSRALSADPPLLVLVLLILAGFGLRIWMAAAYRPTILNITDVLGWTLMARDEVFMQPGHPGGYPLVLRAIHAISDQIDVLLLVQHALGAATALVLYATVLRISGSGWAGVAAAAAVLLSLDQIYLEHAVMSETLFTFGLTVGLFATVCAVEPARRLRGPVTTTHAWLVVTGLVLGSTALVRLVGQALIPLIAVWLLLALPRPFKARLLAAAIVVAAAAVPMVSYAAVRSGSTGDFRLTVPGSTGWALYSRTAPFADCSQFEPVNPRLCESVPPEQRPGPDYYGWDDRSPARRVFGYAPRGGDILQEQALRAITHQPGDYLSTVVKDFARFFIPGYNDERIFAGTGYWHLEIGRRLADYEAHAYGTVASYWSAATPRITGGAATLTEIQGVLRFHPLLATVCVILALCGIALGRGRIRWGVVLMLGAGIVLLAVPVVTATYSARYLIPPTGALAGAGAIGAVAVHRAIRTRFGTR